MKLIGRRGLLLIALHLVSISVCAQDADYSMEYQNKIRASGAVSVNGDTPFGEKIDLYTGRVRFRQTDLSLQGMGPEITVSRKSISGDRSVVNPLMFSSMGDWELEVPQITTLVPGKTRISSTAGIWKTFSGSVSTFDRCTYFGEMWTPGPGYAGLHTGDIDPSYWWQGYELEIPGIEDQLILKRASADAPSSGAYPAVTTSHWQVGCLPQTANGEPGEGFLVISPEGTKYFMNHLVYEMYKTFYEDDPYSSWYSVMPRNIAKMKATRVEDRFGNYIEYSYAENKLTGISGSDGRQVSIQWWSDAPLIRSISSAGQTWTYDYSSRASTGGLLNRVQRPDGSAWVYTGTAAPVSYAPVKLYGCLGPANEYQTYPSSSPGIDSIYSMTAPSGVTGIFRYSARLRAQSYVPSYCSQFDPNGNTGDTNAIFFMASALIQREIYGPGMLSSIWNYSYEAAKPSVERNCVSTPCQSTIYTDVTSPDGNRKRYFHSTRYGALQGKLVREEVYSGSNLKRSSDHLYNFTEADRPFPGAYGDAMLVASPSFSVENLVVLRRTSTNIDSRNFTWEVPGTCSAGLNGFCFDQFGRPTTVIKASSP